MTGCDDVLFEVAVTLPVVLRFTAATEMDARLKYAASQVQIAGPVDSYSVGFPLEMTVKEVAVIEATVPLVKLAIMPQKATEK